MSIVFPPPPPPPPLKFSSSRKPGYILDFQWIFKTFEQLKSPMSGSNKRSLQKVAPVYKEINWASRQGRYI